MLGLCESETFSPPLPSTLPRGERELGRCLAPASELGCWHPSPLAGEGPGERGMALYSGTGPALEYQRGVGATEAEAVGHDQVNRLIQTLTQDRQIRCILVQLFDVGRGGEEVVAH